MFQAPLRALAIAVSVLALAGCQRPYPSQTDARFTLASTQPSGTYQPGDDVTFHVTVTNSGTRDVRFVSISTVVDPDLQVKSYTCTGLGFEAPTSGKAPGPASCTAFEPDFAEHIDGALAAIAGGPAGLLAGTLGDDASTTWLAQDGPLAVVVGQPGTSLDGLPQLYGS